MRAPVGAATVVLVAASLLSVPSGSPASAAGTTSAVLRVDQVGYRPTTAKQAFLLTSAPCAGLAFQVTSTSTVVLSGSAGADAGPWNSTYPHVCPLDLSALAAPGRYVLQAGGTSAAVTVAPASTLYEPLVGHAVRFFQAQRDGADVLPGVLERQPAHLNDRRANVYAPPRYRGETLLGDLHRIGGPVNVAGGWFDAGDFVKFTGTTSFAVAAMLTVRRDDGQTLSARTRRALTQEAVRGITWLQRMYDDRHRTVYYQVGIGSGNRQIVADHDVWRLPQRDDSMTGSARRYLAHRPVFRAAAPGRLVAPSLAGRLAAVFGLCAQNWPNSARGRVCLRDAQHVLALARTNHVGKQRTTSPRSYYPEDQWRDDLEWGAVEIARAASLRPADRPTRNRYARMATHWAAAYRASRLDGGDTLNLYDASALAHVDLAEVLTAAPVPGQQISRAGLVADLRSQLDGATKRAGNDPFSFGGYQWDPTPHALGLVTTALSYDRLQHTDRFRSLAQHQLDWALGDNAWGSSFIIGAGTTFPHCPQHVVANLVGSTDGSTPRLTGGTVDGPSDYIPGPSFFGNAVACPAGGGNPFAAFDQANWRYVDRVSSWSTVEPALDYTAMSLLAFAAAGR
jgi:endoglucanase